MSIGTHITLSTFGEAPKGRGATMSSAEIASLTGKRHDHVIRDAKVLLVGLYGEKGWSFDQVAEDAPNLGHRGISVSWDRDSRGYVTMFHLDERHCLNLVTGYDVRVRQKVIDRWMELEAKVAAPAADPLAILNDPAAMRGLLLTYADKVIALEADKAEMLPKVMAHDRIADLKGTFTRSAAAKILGVNPNKLISWLSANKWTYTRGRDVLGFQAKLDAGYLVNKVADGERVNGYDWRSMNVHITPKGLAALAKAFPPLLQIAGGRHEHL